MFGSGEAKAPITVPLTVCVQLPSVLTGTTVAVAQLSFTGGGGGVTQVIDNVNTPCAVPAP